MSGLLQRLASQVVPGGAPRVRAAVSVRLGAPLVASSPAARGGRDVPPRSVEPAASGEPGSSVSPRRADPMGPTHAADPPFLLESAPSSTSTPAGGRSAGFTSAVPSASSEQAARTTERVIEHLELARLLPEVKLPFESTRPHPLAPVLDGSLANWANGRQAISQGSAEAEPREVHVHIGRIEVTAVQEPAPKRPKREASGPTKTLEEYLGRPRRTP